MKWQPIETAPKDGTQFWGHVDGDAIRMSWHQGFQEFVTSWRRMTFAPKYSDGLDGASLGENEGVDEHGCFYRDHSPDIQRPDFWMPAIKPES